MKEEDIEKRAKEILDTLLELSFSNIKDIAWSIIEQAKNKCILTK